MIGLGVALLVRTARPAAGRSGSCSGIAVPRGAAPGRLYLERRRASGPQAPRPAPRARRAARSSRSPTARSRRRSTSRSGSSPSTPSASRRSCCSASALLFLLVALSYAEATSALPETGGAATFVRRASNDLFGFMTGWVLFLDYLIVIALSALFVPALPRGRASRSSALERNPWDVVVGVCVIVVVGARSGSSGGPSLYALEHDRPRARRDRPARADRLRLRAPLLARMPSCTGPHLGTRADRPLARCSRSRSRCSRSPASRRWRTSPRRRSGPASTCRARSSSRSAPSSPPTSRSPSSGSRPSRARVTELGTVWLRAPLRRHRRGDPGAHRRAGSATRSASSSARAAR